MAWLRPTLLDAVYELGNLVGHRRRARWRLGRCVGAIWQASTLRARLGWSALLTGERRYNIVSIARPWVGGQLNGAAQHCNPVHGSAIPLLTVNLPGPLAASRLAELGALVRKVEPPAGDPLAHASVGRCWNTALRAPVRPSGTKYWGDGGVFG